MIRTIHGLLLLLLLTAFIPAMPTRAVPIANDPFQRTWQRTDKPVADGAVSRTWMWGPEPFSDAKTEAYAESPEDKRTVQYFDKSRMEITDPDGDQSSSWYVTNGLLVVELMSGRMQVGNNAFEDRQPAQINVAGDPDDPLTYAVLAGLRGHAPLATGATITQRINASGQVVDDPSLAHYGVTAATPVDATKHTVASPFWNFMTASGTVYEDGAMTISSLFEDPYYATGLPITEAYWAEVKVGGQQREVLLQCFERRCLTYTPDNPAEWQVEAGNVGQHYYRWRYPEAEPGPNAQANDLARAVMRAESDEARYHALLDVMEALNVGVYSADGVKLVGGAERGVADFYLYDLEVWMLAGALGRGQTYGVVDLAMQLTAMELLPEGVTFDPAVIRQAVLNGVAAARTSPDEFSSLAALIARQMALSQTASVDLFTGVQLESLRLDALSYFLILSDIAVPFITESLPAEGLASNLIAHSNGVLKAAGPTLLNACDPSGFNGDAFKTAWGWSKIYAELVTLVPEAVSKVTVVLDALHGAILAFSVGVTELSQRQETHYGHDEAGAPMVFGVQVMMRDELPRALVDCGWVAGTDFPKQGPIPGVSVHWFWDNLEDHGQVNCGPACPTGGGSGLSIDATDKDGIARMTFQPKNETIDPEEGWIVEEHGMVTGVALYQSKFTNLLGSYGQYLTPKSGSTRWVVKWHEVPGWDVEMKVTYDVKRVHAEDWYWWAKGSMSFKGRIESTGFGEYYEQPFFPVKIDGSGGGSYGYTTNPPVTCSWSGSWDWDQHGVEVLNREQLIVDFFATIGWPLANGGTVGTSHPSTGDCGAGHDSASFVAANPPSFLLTTEETQTIEVAPQAVNLDSGSIVWEITVTPISQP